LIVAVGAGFDADFFAEAAGAGAMVNQAGERVAGYPGVAAPAPTGWVVASG
jgi:hypothetical protein